MRRLAVKKGREAPSRGGNGGRGEETRSGLAVRAEDKTKRGADRLADPADREQQDRAGDRDEDVVEAVDQPKLFFVDRRGRPIGVEEVAKRCGGGGVDRPRGDGLVEILLVVHEHSSLSALRRTGCIIMSTQ
jgi:hypothetical protein